MKSFAKFIAFLTGLLLLSGVVGCGRGKSPKQFLKFGKEYYDQRDYVRAREQFGIALRLQPTNQMALSYLGKILFQQGQIQEAMQYLIWGRGYATNEIESMEFMAAYNSAFRDSAKAMETARGLMRAILERRPTNEMALRVLSETSTDPKSVAEGQAILDSLKERVGDHPSFHVARSVLALRRKDIPTAETELATALKLDPKSIFAHTQLGVLRSSLGKTNEAMASFRSAAELSPPYGDARMVYAVLLIRQGQIEEAKKVLDEINRGAPERMMAWVRRADIAFAEKDYALCSKLLDNAFLQMPTDFEGRLLQAKMYHATSNNVEALKALQSLPEYVVKDRRWPVSKFELGLAQLRVGDQTNAIHNLLSVYSLGKTNLNAANLVAELYMLQNRPKDAIALLRDVTLENANADRSFFLLGKAYVKAGKVTEGLEVYQDMLRRRWVSPGIFYEMGLIYKLNVEEAETMRQDAVSRGRDSEVSFAEAKRARWVMEARRNFARSLELYPNFIEGVAELVDLELKEKDVTAAKKWLEPFVRDTDKSDQLLLLRARVALAEGKRELAEADLEKALEINPRFYPAYWWLAELYLTSRDLPASLRRLDSVLQNDPRDLKALTLKGIIYMDMQRYEESRDMYERALKVQPNLILVLNNLASVLSEKLGKLEEAYHYARKAWQLDPDNFRHSDTLGWIEYRRGDYALAHQLLSQAHAATDSVPRRGFRTDSSERKEVQMHFGHASYMMGLEDLARANLEASKPWPTNPPFADLTRKRAAFLERIRSASGPDLIRVLEAQTKADPQDVVAWVRLGREREFSGDFAAARDSYERALKVNSNAPIAMLRLASVEVDRDANRANTLARRAQQLLESNPEIDWILGRLAYKGGDASQAFLLLQSSASILTNQPSLWLDLSRAAFETGKLTDAESAASKAARTGAKPEVAKAASALLEMVQRSKRPDDAAKFIADTESALKANPNDGPARFALGIGLARLGKYSESKSAFEAVLARHPACISAVRELALLYGNHLSEDAKASDFGTRARLAFPDDVELLKMMGLLASRKGDHRYAVQLLSDAVSAEPNNAELHFKLGASLFALKRTDEARVALEKAISLSPQSKFVPEAKRMLQGAKAG